MSIRKGSRGRRIRSSLVFVILVAGAAFTLFPVYMALLNSLKTEGELLNQILALPSQLQFGNYVEAFEKIHYLRSMWNTIVVAVVGLAGIIVFGSMAGYKISRTRGKLSVFFFGLFVMSMLIPFHSIMITLTQVANHLHLQGSTAGLGMIYIGLGVPMAIFLYHGFVKSIPRDLEEAAVIDGCGEFKLFFVVVFPLLLPISVTVAILNMMWMWNDFLLPLLILTDFSKYTLVLSTNMLFGQYNNDWTAILPALILAMLPVLVMYLLMQKYILNGIADGAIKG